MGDTVVLCGTAAKSVKEGQDFFPLTVHYQEKFSAAGRILGGFFKRERGATEKETLTSRSSTARSARFPEGFYNEILVIAQVLSYDGENEPDIVALIAASAALTLSGVPFMGLIAAARVGYKDGEYILNPTLDEAREGDLDLVVAGTRDAVLMVESEAKELSEDVMLGAVMFAHRQSQAVVDAIIRLAEQAAKEPWSFAHDEEESHAILGKLRELPAPASSRPTSWSARPSVSPPSRPPRRRSRTPMRAPSPAPSSRRASSARSSRPRSSAPPSSRTAAASTAATRTVRPIEAMVGFLPRAHGSALFTRGETQAIVTTTLGTKDSEQMIDGLTGLSYERFMLHYPALLGRGSGPLGARRAATSGTEARLAGHPRHAAEPRGSSPIRVLSDITESNGSSSMATVCGGSLALMDAGVPMQRAVAGIAMGSIKEGDKFAVLSDILGDEDHLGDMDFKVAGTTEGITALQMDIDRRHHRGDHARRPRPGEGRPRPYPRRDGQGARPPRFELSAHAPRIETMQIPKDKIRDVIGTGGKIIRARSSPRPAPRSTSTTRA